MSFPSFQAISTSKPPRARKPFTLPSGQAAGNAGKVHHDRPVILDVDTARMVASGNTVWHAGVTVYLAESVDPELLSITDPDNPEMQILTGMWDEEE